MKLCRKNKNGSWTLSSDYLNYRSEGGSMGAIAWNSRVKELNREHRLTNKKSLEAKETKEEEEQ